MCIDNVHKYTVHIIIVNMHKHTVTDTYTNRYTNIVNVYFRVLRCVKPCTI